MRSRNKSWPTSSTSPATEGVAGWLVQKRIESDSVLVGATVAPALHPGMDTWAAADHPRGDRGRFKAKTRTEPDDGLDADQVASTNSLDGTLEWRDEKGNLHRLDGPAMIQPDGHQEWRRHGDRVTRRKPRRLGRGKPVVGVGKVSVVAVSVGLL